MPIKNDPAQIPTTLEMVARPQAGRGELERFVQQVFDRAWGARVKEFMPWLVGMRTDQGELVGVLGMRPAQDSRLFLEQYLDAPVEHILSKRIGESVARDSIVELGNLAASIPGGARWIIAVLTAFLHASGREWVVFTGGPELRNAFRRLGLPLTELGPAEPGRLGAAAGDWGRYYDQGPLVMAGRVEDGYRRLSALFAPECAILRLWNLAGRLGRVGV